MLRIFDSIEILKKCGMRLFIRAILVNQKEDIVWSDNYMHVMVTM